MASIDPPTTSNDLEIEHSYEIWFQKEVYECKNLTVCANQNDQTHIACFIPRQAEKNVSSNHSNPNLTSN